MQYYVLDSLGQSDNKKYCFTTCFPEGLIDKKLALDYGGSLKKIYPEDPFDVKMYLDEDHPKHIMKGSFISNSDNYLMVDNLVVEELKKFKIGETEFWPFTLINHKGRIHSKDYSFVCPVFPFDALNMEKSDICRDKNNVVIGVDDIVFDNDKVKQAPDLFRINDIRRFAFSEPLANTLLEKYTNFAFEKVEQV